MDEFIKLKIGLEKELWVALRQRAQQDYREPAAQARYLLRNALLGEQSREMNNRHDVQVSSAQSITAVVA